MLGILLNTGDWVRVVHYLLIYHIMVIHLYQELWPEISFCVFYWPEINLIESENKYFVS